MHDLMESATVVGAPRLQDQLPQPGPTRPPARLSRAGFRYLAQQLFTSAPLIAADVLALTLVCGIVSLVPALATTPSLLHVLPFLAAAMIAVHALSGLYPAIGIHPAEELRRYSVSASALAITALCLVLATDFTFGQVATIVVVWMLMLAALPLGRGCARQLAARFDSWAQPVLIIGDFETGASLARDLERNRSCGLRAVGIVGAANSQWQHEEEFRIDGTAHWLGTLEDAASIAADRGIYWAVIIANGHPAVDHQAIEDCLTNIPHRLYTCEKASRNGREVSFVESAGFDS